MSNKNGDMNASCGWLQKSCRVGCQYYCRCIADILFEEISERSVGHAKAKAAPRLTFRPVPICFQKLRLPFEVWL